MIDNIHKQLFLDDPKQFISELTKIKNKIGKLLNEIEKISVDYCAIYQDYLGFYEFTNESLKNIMCDFIGDKYIGKNNILYNAIKFIERFNSLYSDFKNNQFNKCLNANKCLEYPCPFRDKFLNHRFHCIEYNSELYGINKAIDHRNFNFNDIFENDIVDNQGENNTEDSENEHTYPLCY